MLFFSHFTSLPSTVDPATDALRMHRGLLLAFFRDCLPHVTNSFYAEDIIPLHVHDKASNLSLGVTERILALLDSVESRMEAVPSDFTKVVHILEMEPVLESVAEQILQSYCE